MKRAHDQTEGDDADAKEPPAKKPRVKGEEWWFVTADEGGMHYVVTWTPPNEEMAGIMRTVYDAYAKRVNGPKPSSKDTIAFSLFLYWLTETSLDETHDQPELVVLMAATGKKRADFGTFDTPHLWTSIGGIKRDTGDGPIFFFDSWC